MRAALIVQFFYALFAGDAEVFKGVKRLILELEGRKALVVGGSGGMGSAIAKMLATHGVTCGLVGRSVEKLEITANACAELGTPAHNFACDIFRSSINKNMCGKCNKSAWWFALSDKLCR